VSDLDDNDFVKLHVLYSGPEIPASKESIPTQEDVDLWHHLSGVFIPCVDADIGLLIASDMPEALDPVEIRHGDHDGPYASRTRIGWAVNGPLRRSRGETRIVSSFIKWTLSSSKWSRTSTVETLLTFFSMTQLRCLRTNAALCETPTR